MPNSKTIGERSEGMVLAAFLRAGKVLLQPFGDNQRYDLVVDEGGLFIRVQCKTARLKEGFLLFDTCSSQAHRGKGKQGYKGQVDYFAVYSPDLDKVYVLPVADLGNTSCTLRLTPPQDNRTVGLRFAVDYEFKGTFPFPLEKAKGGSLTHNNPSGQRPRPVRLRDPELRDDPTRRDLTREIEGSTPSPFTRHRPKLRG